MDSVTCAPPCYAIKTPTNLSPRSQWRRDYYFQGVQRTWNNEYTAWTTGMPWDFQDNELSFYIVPETYAFLAKLFALLSRMKCEKRRGDICYESGVKKRNDENDEERLGEAWGLTSGGLPGGREQGAQRICPG